MSLVDSGEKLGHPMLHLVFPQHCSCCGRESVGWLCDECDRVMIALACSPRCCVCGLPLAEVDAPCPRCEGQKGRLVATVACLATHSEVLRELIHRLKYSRQWALAGRLAQMLRQQMTVEALLAEADLVVPVPLHWRRRIARGYNQSELLARALTRDTGLRVANLLERTRDTPHQTAIRSLTGRARNVKDAFRMRKGAAGVAGSRIVLVDDVLTTGATVRTAARALKKAGARRIDAIVLAMADPSNRDFQTVSA